MNKGLTPYHNFSGDLNFKPTNIDEKVWLAAEEKWKKLSDIFWVTKNPKIYLSCSLCQATYILSPFWACNECPLGVQNGCCRNLYGYWESCHSKIPFLLTIKRVIAAKRVLWFIQKKHAEWRAEQCLTK